MISYKESLKVKSYETDVNANLKIYAFMNMAQELAGLHADSLGFGYDSLIKGEVVWVLSRMHVKFIRIPKWKEEISIETWHKGSDRLFGFRDFKVTGKSGEQLILATSSWLIININTRKLQRLDSIMGKDSPGYNPDNAIEEAAQRLSSPEAMLHTGNHIVSFSDVDINQHTNNAKYIEWALDSLDREVVKSRTITDMVINFNAESRMGEKIEFYTKEDTENHSLFVEGKRDATSIFQVQLNYLPV